MLNANGVLDDGLAEAVEAAMRATAEAEIMPRWRRLAAHEVTSKAGPHDLVTVADRQAEVRLTEALTALLPGSLVVGEETVHEDPDSYAALRGDAPVWIVDPIDGTRQFVEGRTGFATLVALARAGELLASWLLAPARRLLAHARRGGGAWLDGRRLQAGSPEPGAVLRVACSHPDYTTGAEKRALAALWAPGVAPRASRAAGLEYLDIARGELDAVAYSWELAWDHAAGLLLVTEAGGTHLTPAGEPFDIAGGNAMPFAAARDAETVRRILALLDSGPDAGRA
ncbi:inositol monophosphatase family protein [Streptomyces sp. B6B3]|uniref:inositol monophosphatase family protein n=1 Tax=Streptomyces sp. B6B3 TaxID=3153570 RepID=UPI00325F2487